MKFTNGDINRQPYVKKALILHFVYALFHISNQLTENKDLQTLEGLDSFVPNLDKDMDMMLTTHLKALEKEIEVWVQAPKRKVIAKKLHDKINFVFPSTLLYLQQHPVNLEVLACYIMYIVFVKTDEVAMHKDFEQWTDMTKYSLVVDTLQYAGYTGGDKLKMYTIANNLVLRLL